MEKKYLEVSLNNRPYGAFEDVTSFRDDDNTIDFTSSEGSFHYEKDPDGIYRSNDCDIEFDAYQYEGRRTVKRHFEKASEWARGRNVDMFGNEIDDEEETPHTREDFND